MFTVHHCQQGALAPTTATAAKTSLNMLRVFFKLSALISVRLKCQKYWANFPGVDFLGTALKFRKRKKNSSSLVYTSSITRKIMHFYVVVVQKRQRNVQLEKCGARANLLFFGRSRCCRRRRYLSSRQTSTNGRSKRL